MFLLVFALAPRAVLGALAIHEALFLIWLQFLLIYMSQLWGGIAWL